MKYRLAAAILMVACVNLVGAAFVFSVPTEAYFRPSVDGIVTGPSAAPEPAVNYRYVVDDLALTNFDVRASEGLRLQVGNTVRVFYLPDNPDDSFAITRNPAVSKGLMAAGLFSFVLGSWIWILAPKHREKVTFTPG